MNILIACDSFKDALNAPAVCQAIERGLRLAIPSALTRVFPLSDGGEGLTEVLHFHLGLQTVAVMVRDPLFRPVTAAYSWSPSKKTAFIEMAQAAGLQLLEKEARNPLKTTTVGVGEMIQDALRRGARRIVLGLGGSATHDLGIGMAAALGWQFLDEKELPLSPIGENLEKIKSIIPPAQAHWPGVVFEAMSDVTNPLTGAFGAAEVYAPQKGADVAAVHALEAGALNFLKVSAGHQKVEARFPGAGAAGGLGFGTLFFLQATLKRGIDAVMDLTEFDQQIAWAEVIFTGEGRLDSQTAHGKLVAGILSRAQGKPVVALCGALEIPPTQIESMGLKAAFSIAQKPCTLAEALLSTAENLEKTAFNVGSMLQI